MVDNAHWYYYGVINILKGNAMWPVSSANIYMLLWTAFTPVQNTDALYNNTTHAITGNANCTELAAGNGYVQGIDTTNKLTSVVDPAIYSSTNIILSSANWTLAGPCTFTGVVAATILYNNSGTYYLLGYIAWASSKAGQGGSFTVQCPTAGWFEQPVS